MKQWTTFLFLIWITLSFSNCASVRLRRDVFLSQPVWESTQGPIAKLRSNIKAEGRTGDKRQQEARALDEAPALAGLVQQVLKEPLQEPRLATSGSDQVCAGLSMDYSNPLPAGLAEHPVTRAMVLSMKESYLSMRGLDRTADLPDLKLSHRDFQRFINALNQSMLAPYRTERSQRIEAPNNKPLTYERLLHRYLVAYFNGKYVDRRGTHASKPKLDLTITNQTITALESVFLDSLWDYMIIGSKLKVPMLYKGSDEKPEFLIDATPTLWTVLKDAGVKAPTKGVIEKVAETNNPGGISRAKRCVIMSVSGLAGESALGTSGIAVRALGGVDIGFIILGKLSFGDNDTLMKVVDTWTESLGRHATEIFMSDTLYGAELPQGLAQLCSGE